MHWIFALGIIGFMIYNPRFRALMLKIIAGAAILSSAMVIWTLLRH